ncbi:MAG: carbohydrate ABC transporter permease [Spirochaetaceae bacterium]|nr:carbohydrate ABC transporter permease [Spirochaetaceae bacterium]MBR3813177.1 carbohydrate ABC transporter permease [Spirochaetaceae bacterium]MDD6486113.1 carbohydrate ABC transporter permease [Spirochaetales bacterium]
MNKTNTNIVYKSLKVIFLLIILIYTVFPLYVMFMGGFKTMGQLRRDLLGLPNPVQLDTFKNLLNPQTSTFWRSLKNSFIIMIGTVVFDVVLCCLTGFTFARIKFFGRELLYNYILLGLLFPLAVAILPMYLQMRKIGLIDTYWGVILPQAAFNLAFHTMLTRSFFEQIPMDLEEAAIIDGCGKFGFLVRMVIPLSKPIITTIAVLTLVGSWNQFLLPLLVLNDDKKFTLPLGVMQYQGQYATDWAKVLAYLTLSLIPAVFFYAIAQKEIVAGLTSGAVKE